MSDEHTLDRIVVAIPAATEPIHHVGDVSEPKHMTVLRLGSSEENPDLDTEAVAEAVRAVAESSEGPMTAPVESQGPLGDDGAQVAFLGKEGPQALLDELLAAPVLREGVGAVQQYPEFQPHVTLSYEGEDAAEEGDLGEAAEVPAEVIFDRLGLWDGEEHTEFPLGPSASTEENVDLDDPEVIEPALAAHAAALARNKHVNAGVLYIPETMSAAEVDPTEFEDELVVAMTRPIGDPLVVNDAITLASACEQADALTDPATKMTTRRVLMRRARALGCQHMIPRDWARTAPAAANVTALPARNGTDVCDAFQLKTELSGLSDTALRTAYMRGVREYTMTAPASRPPLPRDVVAQARVNSLIRLAQGDLSARTDDKDLLS